MISTNKHTVSEADRLVEVGGGELARLREWDAIRPQVLPCPNLISPKPLAQMGFHCLHVRLGQLSMYHTQQQRQYSQLQQH